MLRKVTHCAGRVSANTMTVLCTASSPNSKSYIELWLAARTQCYRTEFCLAGLSAEVHFDFN